MGNQPLQHPCSPYYTDDFSDPDSGWPIDDDGDRRYAYIDGQYQIWAKNPSQSWLVTPGAKATDFAAEVSIRRTSGITGAYGIIFGINEDWSEFYEVLIDAEYYGIWLYDGGWTALQDWTSSSHINTGTNWNQLKVVRNGASIELYANDHHLTTVADSSFTGLRRIGLVAFSTGGSALDARFDDFKLCPANCSEDNTLSILYGEGDTALGFEMGTPGIHTVAAPPGRPGRPKRNWERGIELR